MKQRYVAVLASEEGNVLTPTATIAELVSATGKRRLTRRDAVPSPKENTLEGKSMRISDRILQYGFDPSIVDAILSVESGGKGFVNGRVVARFEPHVFLRLYAAKILGRAETTKQDRRLRGRTVILPGMQVQPDAVVTEPSAQGVMIVSNMYVSSRDSLKRFSDGQKRNYADRQSVEYEALKLAASLDRELAYSSTSFGSGQVMGFNHKIVGYASAYEMYKAFETSEEIQQLAVLDFLINRRGTDSRTGLTLEEAVKEGNFVTVAKLYNGDTSGSYANKMSKAHDLILKKRSV